MGLKNLKFLIFWILWFVCYDLNSRMCKRSGIYESYFNYRRWSGYSGESQNIIGIWKFFDNRSKNGSDGLNKFSAEINLVILDIMMPGISGIQTCEEIRKRSVVPILF